MTTPASDARGFVYVATGEKYRREAAASAASLRATHAGARVCLVTDRAEGPVFWDDVVIFARPSFGFRDKIAMRLCPYERFIFLDTDTRILGDLSDIFAVLDRFDFAGHQLFDGHDYQPPGVPDIFPDVNSGVLAFRRSPALAGLFDQWEKFYDAFLEENRVGQYHYANVGDQKSLRAAAYESPLRMAVLGPEYNFVPIHVSFACGPVRVLHGRGPRVDDLARRINRQLGNRVYVPILDAIVSAETLAPELRRLWWGTTLQLCRRVGRQMAPRALREWLRHRPAVAALFLGPPDADPEKDSAAKWRRPPRDRS